MATLGYLPLEIENARYVYAMHLPGVRADVQGFSIADTRISKLTWSECRLLEKTEFMDDLQDVFVYGREPFFIVFSTFYEPEIDAGFTKYRARRAAELLIRGLRLIKSGELWRPAEFVTYERDGVQNTRDPAAFGRLPFTLKEVVRLSTADIQTLEATYLALDFFDCFRNDAAIDRAALLFAASYSPAHTLVAHRLLPLVAALEILAQQHVAALAKAAWMTAELRATAVRFRDRRNHLAHGGSQAEFEWVETTRELTRVLLREAIAWRLEEPDRACVTGKDLVKRCLRAEAANPARLATVSVEYRPYGRRASYTATFSGGA
jgi:hypothetical protein